MNVWPTYRNGDLQLRWAHTDVAGNWVLPELVILYYQLLKYILDFGLFANAVQLGAPWIDINFWNIFFLVGLSTHIDFGLFANTVRLGAPWIVHLINLILSWVRFACQVEILIVVGLSMQCSVIDLLAFYLEATDNFKNYIKVPKCFPPKNICIVQVVSHGYAIA